MPLPKVLDFAHSVARSALRPSDFAVDATVGNGHDTLMLAQAVGAAGRVYGFDIQQDALAAARTRLEAAGMAGRVTLLHRGHEDLAPALPSEVHGRVRAVMFNLGYRPGSDKSVITRPPTTCAGLDAALRVLAPGGVLTVVVYPGHPGGGEESAAVEAWARSRSSGVRAFRYAPVEAHPRSPWALALAILGTNAP